MGRTQSTALTYIRAMCGAHNMDCTKLLMQTKLLFARISQTLDWLNFKWLCFRFRNWIAVFCSECECINRRAALLFSKASWKRRIRVGRETE